MTGSDVRYTNICNCANNVLRKNTFLKRGRMIDLRPRSRDPLYPGHSSHFLLDEFAHPHVVLHSARSIPATREADSYY